MKLSSWIPEYWGDQQKEVWSNLETHWNCLIEGKIPEFLKFIHPDFIGYGHESPLPVDRPWLEKWVGFWTQSTDILICELRPIQMKIHNDIAILQYFIFTIEKNRAGQVKHVIRRYTMTWRREADKHWVVIASHNNLMESHS